MGRTRLYDGPCSFDGCETLAAAKGLCRKHYRLQWNPADRLSRLDNRFWAKVDKGAEDECWLWTGSAQKKKSGKSYGKFSSDGKETLAHRYSYGLHNGGVPDSHTPIHHTCGNTLCVNPKHLQATTSQENTAEMLERRWYKARIAELEAQLAECRCVVNT